LLRPGADSKTLAGNPASVLRDVRDENTFMLTR